MAKKAKSESTEGGSSESTNMLRGNVYVEAPVTTGVDNKLTQGQQGAKARGELDENLNPIPQEEKKADEKGAVSAAEAANDARDDKEKAADEKVAVLQAIRQDAMPNIKVEEQLYKGFITASATAAATGQKVSVKWEQAEPTTEEGLFHSFRQYHPSAVRDSFEIDTKNEADPTLRTYLERTTPIPATGARNPAVNTV